ncbi:hypothetical protein E0500_025060 [Streptomyces sp. KM273126]|nr:hypothetical protein [Streptomyces sp. KM273126]
MLRRGAIKEPVSAPMKVFRQIEFSLPVAVFAPFHHVAPFVELFVEDRRAPAPAAAPEPVADLVGPLGDGVADTPASQPVRMALEL